MVSAEPSSVTPRAKVKVAGASGSGVVPPRYSMAQLGKLQQVSTQIDCGCPNHLSTLVQILMEFETYSKNCENRNEEDARIHRMLYEYTARARGLMEHAMARLIEHENIAV